MKRRRIAELSRYERKLCMIGNSERGVNQIFQNGGKFNNSFQENLQTVICPIRVAQ